MKTERSSRSWIGFGLAACLTVLCLALAAESTALVRPLRPVHANGLPLRIPLSYVDGLSNWGRQTRAARQS